MKKLAAILLTLALMASCVIGVGAAEAEIPGAYEDANGTIQYAKAASEIRYNDGVMTGNGLNNVVDGNYDNAYVSEDAPDMSGQHIRLVWNTPIAINQVSLYANYCGAPGKDGQAPTKWRIEVSKNGTDFTEVCTVQHQWEAIDEAQGKTAQFDLQEGITAVRIVILEANLNWNHYVVSELEIGKTANAAAPGEPENPANPVIPGAYEDANGTIQYAKAASEIRYNDGVMTGNGLNNVVDGNYDSTYVSEDAPDMSAQYIRLVWNTPIAINQVSLYANYCGAPGKDGQAPTKWRIEVSKNGTDFTEVCTVQHQWEAIDEAQGKTAQFDLQEGITAVRIVILEANLNWNHYVVSELEVGQTADASNPGTGDNMPVFLLMALMAFSMGGMILVKKVSF